MQWSRPAATGIASQRVCAKTREFVLGRSTLTNSLDERCIVGKECLSLLASVQAANWTPGLYRRAWRNRILPAAQEPVIRKERAIPGAKPFANRPIRRIFVVRFYERIEHRKPAYRRERSGDCSRIDAPRAAG